MVTDIVPYTYCDNLNLFHLFHLLGLDLDHVSVLAPNQRRPQQQPTSCLVTSTLTPGSSIPPVPPSLVQKIESGAFIELGDLVPNHLGFEETVGSKSKQQPITNISEWLQAFAVYVSVIARKQPQRVPDLMGYQILMLEASNEYQGNCWLAYDRRFRQQAASLPNCKWSTIDSTIWNLAFTGQARASRCRHCFSLFHLSKDCEFASNQTSSQINPPHQMPYRRRYICRHWNEYRGQGCSFPNCRYEHVCYHCAYNPAASDINHKAIFCQNRPSQYSGTLQRPPKPLFP